MEEEKLCTYSVLYNPEPFSLSILCANCWKVFFESQDELSLGDEYILEILPEKCPNCGAVVKR